MKLLVNDKEIINYLCSLLDYSYIIDMVDYPHHNTDDAVQYALGEKNKGIGKWNKKKHKIKDKIKTGVSRDLSEFILKLKETYKQEKEKKFNTIKKNLEIILERLGREKTLEEYKSSNYQGFIKSTGLKLDPAGDLVRRKHFDNLTEDCLFRNMDGNEQMLLTKMNNKWNFWFIDTGYTNFLHGKNKVWHRLVRNNLHHSSMFDAPTSRLGIFKEFPRPWRTDGDTIMIIEPGGFSAKTFGIDIEQWKKDIERELRNYTDKKIIIREKLSKKVRKNLYRELCDNDYYCVVNINSNAATESIWAGIPAITLGRHISNPVTKNQLSDINNLYRGNIANWLCVLSYSQFTFEELMDGTAANILKKYHV